MTLRGRLLGLVAVATLVPAILVGLRFVQDRADAIDKALAELSTTANGIAKDLDQKVLGTAQMQYGLARARDLDTRDRAVCSAFLSAVREEHPQYTGILTIDPDGSLFCDSLQTGRSLDLRDRDYFRKAQGIAEGVALQPAFGRLTGISVLQVAHPARLEGGALKFVLLASLDLQKFAESHYEAFRGRMELLLVDRNGMVLVWEPGESRSGRKGETIAGTALFGFASAQAEGRVGEVAGLDGGAEIWAVAGGAAVRDKGLFVMVGASRAGLVADANRRLLENMTILAALSALLFAGVWMLADLGIRRPVGRIAAMAAKLGQGDMSARIPPPLEKGELGELMTVLNGAAESLESQRDAIHGLNERLREAQKMEALGHLTGGVAHDFNNLLTIIMGNSEHLAEKLAKQPELRKLADMSVAAAARGADLTRSLLAFARRQPLEPKRIDLGQLILRIETLLRRTLGEQIECKLVLGAELWPAVVDPAQLESAVLNLALNARDAMPQGGRLVVEIANARLEAEHGGRNDDVAPGDYVKVAVADTGTGMAPEVVARAFEPFFTTKDVGKGSGLGLSMVYGFVRQSGGTVKLRSQPGQGTVVELYLPRAHGAVAEPDRARPRRAARGGGETILAVEDDDTVRAYVEGELKGLGYEVLVAASGAAALDILARPVKVDLLFTDIVMPGGMLGPELAEAARRLRPTLKILYTSGYSETAADDRSRLARGVQLLGKPYRRQQLAEMLRTVLEGA